MIVDVRLVGLPATDDVGVLLAEVARRIEAASWSASRPTLEEVTDPGSQLFTDGDRP